MTATAIFHMTSFDSAIMRPVLFCLQSGRLLTGLTCLHSSGPLAAPMASTDWSFPRNTSSMQAAEEGGGCTFKKSPLLGCFFGFSFVLVARLWVCRVVKLLERYEELPNALRWCLNDFSVGSQPSSHILNFMDVNINLHEWDTEAKLCWKFLKKLEA